MCVWACSVQIAAPGSSSVLSNEPQWWEPQDVVKQSRVQPGSGTPAGRECTYHWAKARPTFLTDKSYLAVTFPERVFSESSSEMGPSGPNPGWAGKPLASCIP